MNEKAIGILEYKKITELLKEQAGCDMSREMASSLRPETDLRVITEELRSTTEAVDLIVHKGPLPTYGLYDIGDVVSLARKGGCLTMRQLLQVHFNLAIADRTAGFLDDQVPKMPLIESLVELIVPFPRLEQEIDRCIISEDEMADSASPELGRIRRTIQRQNESIRNRLNRMVNSQSNQMYLQDSIVTIKDGRYVIPVKAEHRQKFPGIVHDQSKAGSTLFIEPQAIVEMNNELRELELAEQAEIQRILQSLSDRVAEAYHAIRNNQELLVRLDYIMAKGKLSLLMQGEEPKMNEENRLDLRVARHPLLDPKKVKPIDVVLGGEYQTLVVTGPNTGGKTVTLKLIGLLSMMAQSGLHIPASAESQIPIYSDIFADIGDEQSIEQSLSTFSSHMKNIVTIVSQAKQGTLVLLDELGAGTDPTEGAALAISVLEKLYANGAQVVATTHYTELKKYALSTEGVENASMEFDVDTLSPTYRLLIGTPGKSNAFEISRKLGLSNDLIDRASQLIEQGDLAFEDVITAIETDQKRAADARAEAEDLRRQITEQKQEMAKEMEALEKKKKKILADAREEARDILRDAGDTAKEVQKELKELSRMESLGHRNKEFAKSRKKLRDKEKKYAERVIKQVNTEPVKASDLKIGDRVKVISLNQSGEILSLPDDKGTINVQVGIMKIRATLDDLMLTPDGKKTKSKKPAGTGYGSVSFQKSQHISSSIDVRGQALDEAEMNVRKYIDDVFLSGREEVTIIHGRGEGILAKGLRQSLKRNRYVKSIRAGKYNEGGEGVTIVTMKKK